MNKFSELALSTLFRILTHGYSFQNTTILVTNHWNRSHFSWIFSKFLTFTVHTFVLNQMCPSPSSFPMLSHVYFGALRWLQYPSQHWGRGKPSVSRFVTSIVDPRYTGSRVRISDCRASSILKTVPVSQDSMLNASSENLSTTMSILHRASALRYGLPCEQEATLLESLGISEQTLNTLVRFRW